MSMPGSEQAMRAVPQSKLNEDVLLLILSVSPPKTVTSIMATCRCLYHEGAKIILQDPIRLEGSETTILSLLLFLRAEDFSRCSYVRMLCVDMGPMPGDIAGILVDLLPRLTRLERLELAVEESIKSYPDLLPAFAALQTVKTLVLVNTGERSLNLARTLQSRLTSAYIYLPINHRKNPSLMANKGFHPIYVFQRSAYTLTALTFGLWCEVNPDMMYNPPTVIYPNLRTLTLVNTALPIPIPYMQAYPNLTHLHLSVDSEAPSYHDDLSLRPTIMFQRQQNLAWQDNQQGDAVPWERLGVFTGRVFDLWMLGIAHHIPRLVLEDAPAARPNRALIEVLEYACPEQLTISFRGVPLLEVMNSDFLEALCSTDMSRLKNLKLELHLTVYDCELDVGRALSIIGDALAPLELSHLEITVRDVGLYPDIQFRDESNPLAMAPTVTIVHLCSRTVPPAPGTRPRPVSHLLLSRAERTLDDFDVQVFATRLVKSVPTLRSGSVAIQRPRRCGGWDRVATVSPSKSQIGEPNAEQGRVTYKELRREA
ncbi:hypothetical protein BD311DRAFT_723275 [Dichomitus squalens]|uniref:F-box domain-containing protein n=1 Tax=Dichomitus squalens TaxID=114155 RepID=A0A4Q9MPF3_9APHY|nr:hypothetical protein BD311DRAFT_723275 [Dichomitus squalens]